MDTAVTAQPGSQSPTPKRVQERPEAAIRFAGDSGDGMQLVGGQFTSTTAVFGNDVATFPDYPAEIRAPMGTIAGVSGFQINFSNHDIYTPGDRVDVLVAMNPAALKVNLRDLVDGGIIIVNTDEFSASNLQKALYATNPLESGELDRYQVVKVPITQQTLEAVKPTGLGPRDAGRCKNFYALGLLYWLFDRPLETTLAWIYTKFAKAPAVAEANALALKAGYNLGENTELFSVRYRVKPASLPPGTYRNITGNQATALGLITAARLAGKPLFYGSYPITPASEILHELALHPEFDVRVFQAEDEIAAMCAVVGAAYSGAIAATGTSGPGLSLKSEAIGLGVMTELPMVIVDVQRGGPSTGLPTKTEQSDLLQAMFGRHGDCPVPVLAARSPADCFWSAIEAVRVATKYMTPVILLTDGYLAMGSEPWKIPAAKDLPPIPIRHATDPSGFQPFARNELGARPWAIPGTPGLEHRLSGLEKQDVVGTLSGNPENHQKMTEHRVRKVENVQRDIPEQDVFGPASGALAVVSWGGTYGTVRTAIERAQAAGMDVSHIHLRWIHPMPANLGALLKGFKRVLVCELNTGQLRALLRSTYLVDAVGLNKVQGRPFMVGEILSRIEEVLGGQS